MKVSNLFLITFALFSSAKIQAAEPGNSEPVKKSSRQINTELTTNSFPIITIDNPIVVFTSAIPTTIVYSLYDALGNNLVPQKQWNLINGKNKYLIPSSVIENIILILKISSNKKHQLYKLVPKIDIINKVDGISTKVSANALAKILGNESFVVK